MDLAGGGISPEKLPYIFIKKEKSLPFIVIDLFSLDP